LLFARVRVLLLLSAQLFVTRSRPFCVVIRCVLLPLLQCCAIFAALLMHLAKYGDGTGKLASVAQSPGTGTYQTVPGF
jgi:hypothetical protein